MTQQHQLATITKSPPHPVTLPAPWAVDDQAADQALLALWYQLRDQWLAMAASPHTRRSYAAATTQWLAYIANLGLKPWAVTTAHVRAWSNYLAAAGKSNSTISQRLSAVSSWYSFVINEVHLVDGLERTAFFDADGHTRANPFRTGNIRRPRVQQYGKARPMPPPVLNQLFAYLQSRNSTLYGSRNYALLLAHFLTAARSGEICPMRWGDIRPSASQPGAWLFAWRGKGDKAEDAILPARAYHAIVAHLKIAGRLETIDPDDHIWIRLTEHGLGNLASHGHGAPRPHIAGKNVQRILKTSLRNAGVDGWNDYRVHDLRHSFAHLYHEQIGDLEALRRLLHHGSIATTGVYIRSMQEPVDAHSETIYQQLGLL